MIKYKDGRVFSQHREGSQMLMENDGMILVENKEYLTVRIDSNTGDKRVLINDWNYIEIK